jgi:hypothetical protein
VPLPSVKVCGLCRPWPAFIACRDQFGGKQLTAVSRYLPTSPPPLAGVRSSAGPRAVAGDIDSTGLAIQDLAVASVALKAWRRWARRGSDRARIRTGRPGDRAGVPCFLWQ